MPGEEVPTFSFTLAVFPPTFVSGNAAIGVIVAEIAARDQCLLSIGAIAGRAGVCLTIVRTALRQARSLGCSMSSPGKWPVT